jgi:hypothetical protein
MSGKFQIEPITPSDEGAVRAFMTKAIARPGAAAATPAGWLGWLSQGAAVAGVTEIPVGWKLMAEGEMGGVHLVVPFRVAAGDGEAISIQSAGYYVDPRWHGPASGALFLALMKYRARFHCSVGTANEASARVWRAFKAEEQKESGHEWCRLRFSAALLEEALVRRMRCLRKLFPREALALRASLPRRLEELKKNLGPAVKAAGRDAVAPCAALPFHAGGALPTAPLLEWKLNAPEPRYTLLHFDMGGLPGAVFLTAAPRGHRGQTPTLSVSALWGPAWDADPAGVLTRIIRAGGRAFPFITLGFGTVPESVRPLLRSRTLDAPRRWVAHSPAQPPARPGWNGLDAL